MGAQVWFERARLPAVRRALVRRLTDVRWGWNTEGDRAWVQAEAGVDLEALVAAVPVDPEANPA